MYRLMIPLAILTSALSLALQEQDRPSVPLRDARMTIEWAPGVEAVLHISAESEEELEDVRIQCPDGRTLVEFGTHASLGLASLELEFPGPTLEELQARCVEGDYVIRASTVGGRMAVGSARLSFDFPARPVLFHPRPSGIATSSTTICWLRNHDAVSYELQLEQGENDGLRVRLPPEQTVFRIPPGLLARNTETNVEIAAIGANGNRTTTEVRFLTAP